MVSSLCQNDFVFETLTSNPNRLATLDVMLVYYVGTVVQDIPENTNKRLKTELFRNSRNPLTSAILFQVELSSQMHLLYTAAICRVTQPTAACNIKEHFKSQVQLSTRSLGLLQKEVRLA